LIKFFEWRGCSFPEDDADETINRVVRKIDQGEEIHNPSSYFYGVARMVFMERLRKQEKERAVLEYQPRPAPENPGESDQRLECVRQCMQRMALESRSLLVEYYEGEEGGQIKIRQELAKRLRLSPNALRIRACRLRKELEDCVSDCLEQASTG
jgi:DNA-directed RNA polymerase specialized sigma24 family protein